MATQTLVITSSDLSGDEGAMPVKFGLFGVEYEIDLTTVETEKLESLLSLYTSAARRIGGRRNTSSGTPGARPAGARPGGAEAFTGASSKVVRAWAKEQGIDLPDRGRVPLQIQEAFVASRNAPIAPVVEEPVVEAPANGTAKRARARKAVAAPEFVAPPAEAKPRQRRTRALNGGA